MKTFELILNKKTVCAAEWDAEGKFQYSCREINDVHKFCRTILSFLDDLPVNQELPDVTWDRGTIDC